MDEFDKYLNPRSIIIWYFVSLLFSILGTYLAYNEPIGSEAWRIWSPAGEDACYVILELPLALGTWYLSCLMCRILLCS